MSNLEGKYLGRTDEPLCESGRAGLLQLAREYRYPGVDHVFSSPLKRCMDTAKILYPESPIDTIAEFSEVDFGDFEGKTTEELEGDSLYREWLKGGSDACPPHGESNRAFASRICNHFIKVADSMVFSGVQNTAIITGGGAIMTILSAFGVPQLPMNEWLTPAGCGYTLLLSPSLWASHKKIEVYCDIPEKELTKEEEAMFWDWYPEE